MKLKFLQAKIKFWKFRESTWNVIKQKSSGSQTFQEQQEVNDYIFKVLKRQKNFEPRFISIWYDIYIHFIWHLNVKV